MLRKSFLLFSQVVNTGKTDCTRLLTLCRHVKGLSTQNKMSFKTVQRGTPNTESYRLFFQNEAGEIISPFHDIPLAANASLNTFNMLVEIPRWSNAKMEVSTGEKLNPIKQDVKKGLLRYVKNIFPHHGYIWNYGALPQTYEDPDHITEDTGKKGDCDPLDICEIGHKIHRRGSIIQVKILGVMCLIDEGETDWKLLGIDVTDPLAPKMNDIEDVEEHCPGLLTATYEWFKFYKVPDGKPENQFAFNGKPKNREYALGVIKETHDQWKSLVCSDASTDAESKIAKYNVTIESSPYLIESSAAEKILEESPPLSCDVDPIDEDSRELNKWHYVIKPQ